MDRTKHLPAIAAGAAVLGAAALCAETGGNDFVPWSSEDGVTFRVARGGGRILDLRFGGTPLMHPPDDAARYGSTFWPSPQSAWKWPPPEALHAGEYRIVQGDGAMEAESETDQKTGLRVFKIFERGPRPASVRIRYTLENRGTENARWAPWEITQLLPGGLVFFPGTADGTRTKDSFAVPEFEESGGVLWRKAEALPGGVTGLAIGDSSEGWIAYALGQVLMVKAFEVVPRERHAPGEGQVELFFDGDGVFWEMEVQGPYEDLPPGGKIEMEVVWAFAALDQPAEETPRERLVELSRQLRR